MASGGQKVYPPTTFEEWLRTNKLDDWPHHVEEEFDEIELHSTPHYLGMGSLDEICKEIKARARILFSHFFALHKGVPR